MQLPPDKLSLRGLVLVFSVVLGFLVADRALVSSYDRYTASTTIQFEDEPRAEFSNPQAILRIITSEEVLGPVIKELDLGDPAKDLTKLAKKISMKDDGNTQLMRIEIYAGSPVEAVNFANAISESLGRFLLAKKQERDWRELSTLEQEIQRQREKVKTLRENALRIREQNGIFDVRNILPSLMEILRKRIDGKLETKEAILRDIRSTPSPRPQPNKDAIEKYREAKKEYYWANEVLNAAEMKLSSSLLRFSTPQPALRVWYKAEPPILPEPEPRPGIILALGIFAGFLCGAALAFLSQPGIVALILFVLIVLSFPRWTHLLPSEFFSATVTGFADVAGYVTAPQRVECTPNLTMKEAIWKVGGFTASGSAEKSSYRGSEPRT